MRRNDIPLPPEGRMWTLWRAPALTSPSRNHDGAISEHGGTDIPWARRPVCERECAMVAHLSRRAKKSAESRPAKSAADTDAPHSDGGQFSQAQLNAL